MSPRSGTACALLVSGALACDPPRDPPSSDTDAMGETEPDLDVDASSGDESGAFEVACDEDPVLTFDTFGRGFLATYCNGCHGGQVVDRKGAPPAVVFDDREMVSTFAERILVRVSPPDGVPPMPPAGGVTPDDLDRVRIWLTCYP